MLTVNSFSTRYRDLRTERGLSGVTDLEASLLLQVWLDAAVVLAPVRGKSLAVWALGLIDWCTFGGTGLETGLITREMCSGDSAVILALAKG